MSAAQDNTLVVSSWGGNFGEAQRAAQFEPFTAETGIEITLAPQQPELALIEAQVSSGKVEWDLAENSNLGAYTLAGKGVLEPIDYGRMDAKVIDGVQDDRVTGLFNGRRAIVVNITQQAGANVISVVDKVRAELPALQAELPSDVTLEVA